MAHESSSRETKPGPDAIWAPWRLPYLESIDDDKPASPPDNKPGSQPSTGCFLANYWASPEDDERNHVIVRTDAGMILLNAYPYANGHLLVALGDGRPRLLDYEPAQRAVLWELV